MLGVAASAKSSLHQRTGCVLACSTSERFYSSSTVGKDGVARAGLAAGHNNRGSSCWLYDSVSEASVFFSID